MRDRMIRIWLIRRTREVRNFPNLKIAFLHTNADTDDLVDSDLDGSRNMGAAGTGTRSGLTGTSGATGSATAGSGLTSSNTTGSGLTGTSNTGGSGLTGSKPTGSGMEKPLPYAESNEQHRKGDGHPEDILHPGSHVTETAKKLDPHFE